MAIVVDHESEYKGEQKVRDAIADYFSDEVVVYNNREVNGREYDICLLVKKVFLKVGLILSCERLHIVWGTFLKTLQMFHMNLCYRQFVV